MQKKSVRHHYVPRLILKNFAVSDQIFVLTKNNSNVFKGNIQKVFSENRFNTIQDSVELENVYSKIETKIAPIISKIIKTGNISWFDNETKKNLLFFFDVQHGRTHSTRENIKKIAESIIDKNNDLLYESGQFPHSDELEQLMKENSAKKFSDVVKTKIDEDWIKAQTQFVMPEGLEKNKNFMLLKNPRENFYISDKCAIMRNLKDMSPYGNLGYAVPFVEMYMPLSPEYTLGIFDRLNMPYMKDGETIEISEENVIDLNYLQVVWAHRFIACKADDFTLANQILDENPDLRKGCAYSVNIT